MKVSVLGTGNVAHSIAVQGARAGLEVVMAARSAERAAELRKLEYLTYTSPDGDGRLPMPPVSADVAETMAGAEIIFLAVSSPGHASWLEQAAPALASGQVVVVIGNFAGLRCLRRLSQRRRGVHLVELSTSPFPCRSFAPGTAVLYGSRPSLPCAIYSDDVEMVKAGLGRILGSLTLLQNPLAVGLSFTNPVTHAPLMLLNAGRIESADPRSWSEFGDGATPAVVEMMLACDTDRRAIGSALGLSLPMFAANRVPRGTPEQEIATELSRFFRSSPMHIDPRHHTPDTLANRYVLDDIPFGLGAWAALGDRLGLDTPALDAMLTLYAACRVRIGGNPPTTLADLGLADKTAAELIALTAPDLGAP